MVVVLKPPAVDAPEVDSERLLAHAPTVCYLCGKPSVLACELCERPVCKQHYREDLGPCLIERDWCIPCADKKAAARTFLYGNYLANRWATNEAT